VSTRAAEEVRALGFRLASALLQYPDAELAAASGEIEAAARELPDPSRTAVGRFLAHAARTPMTALQQEYVRSFDFQKRASLYLTFHLHGDQRKRGPALLRLKRLYAAAGFPHAGGELPDFLPGILEFAAVAAPEHGALVLDELRPAFELVRRAARDLASPYADVLDAVAGLMPPATREQIEAARRIAAEGPPMEEVGVEPFAPLDVMPPLETGADR